MNRPEDGSWDPSDPRNFYFNTTAAFNGISRIWKLRFSDPSNVLKGGVASIEKSSPPFDSGKPSVEQVGPRMLDNMTVTERGQVISLEDTGNNAYVAGVYQYDPASGNLARVAEHDRTRFQVGSPGLITQDEESSGVIPAPFLGAGKYLIDVQNHSRAGTLSLLKVDVACTASPAGYARQWLTGCSGGHAHGSTDGPIRMRRIPHFAHELLPAGVRTD
jgi:hypothetical protein